MTMQQAVEECCSDDSETVSWWTWKMGLKEYGIHVMDDDSGFADSKKLTGPEARAAIARCTVKFEIPEGEEIAASESNGSTEMATGEVISPGDSVAEWCRRYDEVRGRTPIGEVLTTTDGTPVRLEIVLLPGKLPLIHTRIFVPDIVCSKLGWFAQSLATTSMHGWKLILLSKSRDAAIRHFGLQQSVVGVKSVRVIKASFSNESLLGEIAEW